MIHFRQSITISYGRSSKIAVYQDFNHPQTWYMAPIPRLVYNENNKPVFSITQKLSHTGELKGHCTFDVELDIPALAKRTAEATLGNRINRWGKFRWEEVNLLFHLSISGKIYPVQAQLSHYGINKGTITAELPTEKILKAFIAYFEQLSVKMVSFTVAYGLTSSAEVVDICPLSKEVDGIDSEKIMTERDERMLLNQEKYLFLEIRRLRDKNQRQVPPHRMEMVKNQIYEWANRALQRIEEDLDKGERLDCLVKKQRGGILFPRLDMVFQGED